MSTNGSAKCDRPSQDESGSDLRYLSPRDLAYRWRCSRSTVDRIARREGLTRLLLGEGRHGIVRFLREEIETLEASRMFDPNE